MWLDTGGLFDFEYACLTVGEARVQVVGDIPIFGCRGQFVCHLPTLGKEGNGAVFNDLFAIFQKQPKRAPTRAR